MNFSGRQVTNQAVLIRFLLIVCNIYVQEKKFNFGDTIGIPCMLSKCRTMFRSQKDSDMNEELHDTQVYVTCFFVKPKGNMTRV